MRNQKNSRVLIAVVALVTVAGMKPALAENKSDIPAAAAPAWALQDVTGKTIRASDFQGRVVVIDFWATWCGPCRAEVPALVALQREYEKEGLTVVGASVDEGGPELVKPFIQKEGINYRVVLADEKMQQTFGGIEVIPTIFVINRQGRVVTKHLGFVSQHDLEVEIKPLLDL